MKFLEFERSMISEARMRANVVVMTSVRLDDDLGFPPVLEPLKVEAFFSKATVETFIAFILPRLSRSNSRRLDAFFTQPCLNRIRDELGTMITT